VSREFTYYFRGLQNYKILRTLVLRECELKLLRLRLDLYPLRR
jgi:hypothetical protein